MAVAAASGDLAVGEDDLAAGNREQAARGEFLRARHRSAELDDPAAGDTDISGFPVTGRDHRRTADTQVKTHHSILARGRLATP